MANIRSKTQDIYSLEQLSSKSSRVHALHPMVKLISTLLFVVIIVSFNRYEFVRLIPFVFYPVILMALSETPWSIMLRRAALALPFALLAGISNILFDTDTAFVIGYLPVSFGLVSFISILFRTFLCVAAVLILVAVTPFNQLTNQLRRLHAPDIFVTLFEMIYRYIGVLLDEASAMYTAYILRSTEHKGLQMRHMGSFAGQLLIRSYDRAERVYNAMKCRGYNSLASRSKVIPLTGSDIFYLAAVSLPVILLRVFDINKLFTAVF